MRVSVVLLISVLIYSSCGQENDKKIREKVIAVAESYSRNQLTNPQKVVLKDGTLMLGDTLKRYFIQPSAVFIGLIDDDDSKDAIVSITSMQRYGGQTNEHLIITKTGGKYILIRSIESNMKILSVKERVITADVPTHAPDNPLYNCSSCREVVKYRFKNGELIRI